jgi:hypothetical protein
VFPLWNPHGKSCGYPSSNHEAVGAGDMIGPLIKAAITAAMTPIGQRVIRTGVALGTQAVLRKGNGPEGSKPGLPVRWRRGDSLAYGQDHLM